MTGIQHPYEEPEHPDLTIDTSANAPENSVNELLAGLKRLGKM